MSDDRPALARRALAEALGTLGIGLAVFLALPAAIASLGDVSGAHFNPGISRCFFHTHHLPARDLAAYVAAQLAGGAPLGASTYQFTRA